MSNARCRLCTRRTESQINLLEGNFRQLIFDLTAIQIDEVDLLPTISCVNCIEDLQKASKIRKKIIHSHQVLLKLHRAKVAQKSANKVVKPQVVKVIPSTEFDKLIINKKCSKTKSTVKVEEAETNQKAELCTPQFECGDYAMNYEDINVKNENETEEILIEQSDICNSAEDVLIVNNVKPPSARYKPMVKIKLGKRFRCEECDLDFTERYSYNLHMCKHKKSQCKICGILIRSDNMTKHMECHTSGPRICDLCGTTCKNIESLRGHIFYMHRKAADEYKCDECDKTFRMKYKLDLHKRKQHLGVRSHICKTCNKGFFTIREMNHHVNMTHLKLRPHVCPHCERGFSSKYALKTHVRQHTNETPYKCYICAEGFRQNVSLRTHLKSKHNIMESKDFQCEFCDKAFSTDHALKVHVRLHTDDHYKCHLCSEIFHQKSYLYNHLKSYHNLTEMPEVKKTSELAENMEVT